MDCIFCKIINGELKAEKVFENEHFIVIKDNQPKAKNHFLAIPKNHFKLLSDMTYNDLNQLKECFLTIPRLTEKLHLEKGYRLIINQGEDAGQSVFHLHIHIISGQKMQWTPA